MEGGSLIRSMFQPHLSGSAKYMSRIQPYKLLTFSALFEQVWFLCMLVNFSVTDTLSTPIIAEHPSVECQEFLISHRSIMGIGMLIRTSVY